MSHILEVGELLATTLFQVEASFTSPVRFGAIRGTIDRKDWVTEAQLQNPFHKFGSFDVVLIRTLVGLPQEDAPGIYVYEHATIEVMPIVVSQDPQTGSAISAQLVRIEANVRGVKDHFILIYSDGTTEKNDITFRYVHISADVARFISDSIYSHIAEKYRNFLLLLLNQDFFTTSEEIFINKAVKEGVSNYSFELLDYDIFVEVGISNNREKYPRNIYIKGKQCKQKD